MQGSNVDFRTRAADVSHEIRIALDANVEVFVSSGEGYESHVYSAMNAEADRATGQVRCGWRYTPRREAFARTAARHRTEVRCRRCA